MVPVAGEDAVLDGPAMEWKSEVGTTVVQRMHLALVINDEKRAAPAADHHLALGFEFVQGAGAYESVADFVTRCVHIPLSPGR